MVIALISIVVIQDEPEPQKPVIELVDVPAGTFTMGNSSVTRVLQGFVSAA